MKKTTDDETKAQIIDDNNAHAKETILVIGASGGTGLRALSGLVDVGYIPSQIRVMTRNETKSSITGITAVGISDMYCQLGPTIYFAKCNSWMHTLLCPFRRVVIQGNRMQPRLIGHTILHVQSLRSIIMPQEGVVR